jgi:hypothetical protein
MGSTVLGLMFLPNKPQKLNIMAKPHNSTVQKANLLGRLARKATSSISARPARNLISYHCVTVTIGYQHIYIYIIIYNKYIYI